MATAIIRRWDGTSLKSFRFDACAISPFQLFELVNRRERDQWQVIDIWQRKRSSEHDCQITCNGDLIDMKLAREEDQKTIEKIRLRFEELHELYSTGGV